MALFKTAYVRGHGGKSLIRPIKRCRKALPVCPPLPTLPVGPRQALAEQAGAEGAGEARAVQVGAEGAGGGGAVAGDRREV